MYINYIIHVVRDNFCSLNAAKGLDTLLIQPLTKNFLKRLQLDTQQFKLHLFSLQLP